VPGLCKDFSWVKASLSNRLSEFYNWRQGNDFFSGRIIQVRQPGRRTFNGMNIAG
jgi:hypothetical protein